MNTNILENINRIKEVMGLLLEDNNDKKILSEGKIDDTFMVILGTLDNAASKWFKDTDFWENLDGFRKNIGTNKKPKYQALEATELASIFATKTTDEKAKLLRNFITHNQREGVKVSEAYKEMMGTIINSNKRGLMKSLNKKGINNFNTWWKKIKIDDVNLKNALEPQFKIFYKKHKTAILDDEQIKTLTKAILRNYNTSFLNDLKNSFSKSIDTIKQEIIDLNYDYSVQVSKLDTSSVEKIKTLTDAYTLEISKKLNELNAKGKQVYKTFYDDFKRDLDDDLRKLLENPSLGLFKDLDMMRNSSNEFKKRAGDIIAGFFNDMRNIIKIEINGKTMPKISFNPRILQYFFLNQRDPRYVLYKSIINHSSFETITYTINGRTKTMVAPLNVIKSFAILILSSQIMTIFFKLAAACVFFVWHYIPFERGFNNLSTFFGFGKIFDDVDEVRAGSIVDEMAGQFGHELHDQFKDTKVLGIMWPFIEPALKSFGLKTIMWMKDETTLFSNVESAAMAFINGLKGEIDNELVNERIDFEGNFLSKHYYWKNYMNNTDLKVFKDDDDDVWVVQNNDKTSYFKKNNNTYIEVDSNGKFIPVRPNTETDDVRNTGTVDQNDGTTTGMGTVTQDDGTTTGMGTIIRNNQ